MDIHCPQCDSVAFKKNGYTRHGKQNHRCLDCGRQFSCAEEEELVGSVSPSNFSVKLNDRKIKVLS